MQPSVLEHFLADEEKYGKKVLCEEDIAELRESFMEMWGLDVGEDMITTGGHRIWKGELWDTKSPEIRDGSRSEASTRRGREQRLQRGNSCLP
jgi:hypothetical protein